MRMRLGIAMMVLAACSNSERSFVAQPGSISGRVVKGPVRGATVTVLEPLSNTSLGSTTTDADGAFRVEVGAATGDMRLCASGGVYSEEATGTSVQLGARVLCAPVLDFEEASSRSGVLITPWSHFVMMRTQALVSFDGQSFHEAATQAASEINGLLACAQGDLSLLGADPADPTVAAEVPRDLTPSLLSGILLGGLSHQAKLISEEALKITAGVSVTALSLTMAYGDDLAADGRFDGIGVGGPLHLEGYALDSTTFRGATRR